MKEQKKFFNPMIALMLTICLVLTLSLGAYVSARDGEGANPQIVFEEQDTSGKCTMFYLGKDTTENGSYIWGRTEDISARYAKQFMVHEAETYGPEDMYESSSGFRWPYPEKTLRYTLCRDSWYNEEEEPEPYAEVGVNERNVAISATVTLSEYKTEIGNNEPMVSKKNGGLSEMDLATVVLMQATSARNACELVAKIIDDVGAASREGFMVSDPKEVWYFQILSGHQYVAVKCPNDRIGFSPNITGNVDLSDPDLVITSPDLYNVAKTAGTLAADENGKIKIADSYANPISTLSGRTWLGYYYLKDEAAAEQAAAEVQQGDWYMDFFTAPRENGKYTLYEAMRLLAFRGEGTEKDAGRATGNSNAIGNDGTLQAHVFETRDHMPDALATVEWLCVAPPEFGVYLPYYGSLITGVFEKYYEPDAGRYNGNDPDDNSMYWVFRELYTLCKGPRDAASLGTRDSRTRYGAGVMAFWERYQKELIEQQAVVDADMLGLYDSDPDAAQEMATAISKALAEETYECAKQMLMELKAFQDAGTAGNFIPSALLDDNALPHYPF